MIAIFGAFSDPAHDLEELLSLLGRKQFIVWMVMTFLIAIFTVFLARFFKYLSPPSRHHQNGKLEHVPSQRRTSSASTNRRKSRIRTLSIPVPQSMQNVTPRAFRLRMLRGLSYGLISGILSAHSLLVAKSAVELIVRTIVDRNNQFNKYQSWLILIALVALALTQLYYLHAGLRLCSTSVLYPFVFCIYNIIAILDGLIYFRQTDRLNPLHGGLIALGTVILLSGVVALSWRLDDTSPTDSAAVAPQPPAPVTPLTPSLGFVPRESASSLLSHGSDDDSDLIPAAKRRRRAHTTTTDTTPLLSAPGIFDARRRSVHDSASTKRRSQTAFPAPINTTPVPPSSRSEIWRELNDDDVEPGSGSDDNDDDYLASLPKASSPWLHRDDCPRPASRKSYGSLGSGNSIQHSGERLAAKHSDWDHRGHHHRSRDRKNVNGNTSTKTDDRRSSAPTLVGRKRGGRRKRRSFLKANGNSTEDDERDANGYGQLDRPRDGGEHPERAPDDDAGNSQGRSSITGSIRRSFARFWSGRSSSHRQNQGRRDEEDGRAEDDDDDPRGGDG